MQLGDLANPADLNAAVAGMDAVIHCAGVVRVAALRRGVWEANVNGTERLLAASARTGLSRFVYLSSVGVYGHAPPPITEDVQKRPVGAYGESKWAAERALWRYRSEHRLPAVALRPCVIYGPRDRRASRALLRMCQMRVVPLPRGGRRVLDLVYVTDVADAALAAATTPGAVGHAYNITDGETHTYRDILVAYSQISGRSPAILPVPGRAVVLALQAGLLLRQTLRGASGDWAGQIDRVRALDMDAHYEIGAARRGLGYAPQVGLVEGLQRILSWSMEQKSESRRGSLAR